MEERRRERLARDGDVEKKGRINGYSLEESGEKKEIMRKNGALKLLKHKEQNYYSYIKQDSGSAAVIWPHENHFTDFILCSI